MKKQHKTYLLLTAVLIIWGLIGYQIYIRLNPPTPELEVLDMQIGFQKENITQTSFYELNKEYRDPFLGKFPKKKVVKKRNAKKVEQPKTPFPNVVFNGMVQGNSNTSYILTINGKQEILKIGKSSQNIKLMSANEKQIKIIFGKETKIINKQ